MVNIPHPICAVNRRGVGLIYYFLKRLLRFWWSFVRIFAGSAWRLLFIFQIGKRSWEWCIPKNFINVSIYLKFGTLVVLIGRLLFSPDGSVYMKVASLPEAHQKKFDFIVRFLEIWLFSWNNTFISPFHMEGPMTSF